LGHLAKCAQDRQQVFSDPIVGDDKHKGPLDSRPQQNCEQSLAEGESPVTRIRPALSRRWEAARVNQEVVPHPQKVRGRTAAALLFDLSISIGLQPPARSDFRREI